MDIVAATPSILLPPFPIARRRARLPRYWRVPGYPAIRIGRPKQRILEALAIFTYLTAPQFARLAFSPTSLSYVRRHLMELYHAAYVERLFLAPTSPCGSALAVYRLDRKGQAWLKAAGQAIRSRPCDDAPGERLFLRHTLQVNDFLIAVHQAARVHPELGIASLLTERELKRRPMYVPDGAIQVAVVPDGFLDLRFKGYQVCLALELDRGTVERKPFERKIRAFLAATSGAYQQTFQTQSLTVVFVVTAGERRLRELLTWTERELTKLGAERHADLFRFAALDPVTTDPAELFFGPRWLRPFDPVPRPLLLLPAGVAEGQVGE